MGTNYYVEYSEIHPQKEKLHIGKSSAGWCFMLHVIPELNLNSFEDWEKLWSRANNEITNEYGDKVSIEEMTSVIKNGSWDRISALGPNFHRHNYSQLGPNGLVRFRLDSPGCVGHGQGTWDLIEGEFS
jgi:hypothetical protein